MPIFWVNRIPRFDFLSAPTTNSTTVGKVERASVVFQDLQVGQTKVLKQPRSLWGHRLYIAALRLEDGELLIVATQVRPESAIADYAQRWGIETLFGIFKTRGFCLESTHLSDAERLSKRLALLSLRCARSFSQANGSITSSHSSSKSMAAKPKAFFAMASTT